MFSGSCRNHFLVVFEDNQAAISIAQKEEQSKRSKHYLIKAAFLTDSFKRGIFRYAKVGTKEQLADAFTKALPRDDFNRFRSWMGSKFSSKIFPVKSRHSRRGARLQEAVQRKEAKESSAVHDVFKIGRSDQSEGVLE